MELELADGWLAHAVEDLDGGAGGSTWHVLYCTAPVGWWVVEGRRAHDNVSPDRSCVLFAVGVHPVCPVCCRGLRTVTYRYSAVHAAL